MGEPDRSETAGTALGALAGTPLVSFIISTVLAQTLGTRDHATGIAEIFGATFVFAIMLGFVYGRGSVDNVK